eukprot:jgi/Botrbrau1/18253/Bobra.0677s0001.1
MRRTRPASILVALLMGESRLLPCRHPLTTPDPQARVPTHGPTGGRPKEKQERTRASANKPTQPRSHMQTPTRTHSKRFCMEIIHLPLPSTELSEAKKLVLSGYDPLSHSLLFALCP